MRDKILIVFLSLGSVLGFASGFAHLGGWGGWHGRWHHGSCSHRAAACDSCPSAEAPRPSPPPTSP